MAPPILKILELLTDKKDNLFTFLDGQNFNERPVLISLNKFTQSQEALLELLDEYFSLKETLYPVYIQTHVLDFPTHLNIVQSSNEVPKFFKQKTKQLNIKENLVFNKIKLKQDQLRNFNKKEVIPIIESYSENHRAIKEKSDYLLYLKSIVKEIRSKHES